MMFPCVLLGGGGGLRLWAWAVLYSGLVYFSIWAERAGRLKADVSDGLDVAMWNNLFIRLGL
ncbi:YeeE/YedE protein [Neisseria sp. HMSC072B12]|uniref:YeeE/YedE protein n=1 Tax=Neisseria sp. HMSC072B12 TaxID=1715080 RepID=UPI00201EF6F6|nr:YeeE/YedE protein [Neisseria sp. HMSC072B12]